MQVFYSHQTEWGGSILIRCLYGDRNSVWLPMLINICMSVCSIITVVVVWYIIGIVVTTFTDETEHRPLGWAEMLPDCIPVWMYAWIWPIVCSFKRLMTHSSIG
jgi:hypothetical protein